MTELDKGAAILADHPTSIYLSKDIQTIPDQLQVIKNSPNKELPP
jgi:hypothetical protein